MGAQREICGTVFSFGEIEFVSFENTVHSTVTRPLCYEPESLYLSKAEGGLLKSDRIISPPRQSPPFLRVGGEWCESRCASSLSRVPTSSRQSRTQQHVYVRNPSIAGILGVSVPLKQTQFRFCSPLFRCSACPTQYCGLPSTWRFIC